MTHTSKSISTLTGDVIIRDNDPDDSELEDDEDLQNDQGKTTTTPSIREDRELKFSTALSHRKVKGILVAKLKIPMDSHTLRRIT
jgi:hypothetical protein